MPQTIRASYSKQTSNSREYSVQRGVLNKFRIRPQIINEHSESSRSVQGIVTAVNIVGQAWQASHDNINGIGGITLEGGGGSTLEDFESYADSAALQAEWVEGSGASVALLDETIFSEGSKSMNIPTTVADGEWINTIPSIDYTDFQFDMDIRQSNLNGPSGVDIEFFIGDGANTKSVPLIISNINTFENIEVPESAMVEDAGITDVTSITKIGFRCTRSKPGSNGWVDNIIATPKPGSVLFKLWDFGKTLPESGIDGLNDADQYEELGDRGFNSGAVAAQVELNLIGGQRAYSIKDFIAGVALEIPSLNTPLIPGNYYAITIHYVDTEVAVYGSDPSLDTDYYSSGYAFTTPDESSVITTVGANNDIAFEIFSTQHVWIGAIFKQYDAIPGSDARESMRTETANMKIEDVISSDTNPEKTFLLDNLDKFSELPKGGKFELYYNPDGSDDVSSMTLLVGYIFEPEPTNG
jgi:hypothetical protein